MLSAQTSVFPLLLHFGLLSILQPELEIANLCELNFAIPLRLKIPNASKCNESSAGQARMEKVLQFGPRYQTVCLEESFTHRAATVPNAAIFLVWGRYVKTQHKGLAWFSVSARHRCWHLVPAASDNGGMVPIAVMGVSSTVAL